MKNEIGTAKKIKKTPYEISRDEIQSKENCVMERQHKNMEVFSQFVNILFVQVCSIITHMVPKIKDFDHYKNIAAVGLND